MRKIDDPAAEIEKKLDEVPGTSDAGPTHLAETEKDRLIVSIVGAGLADIAVATIVLIIESHRLPKEMPKAAVKPVQVQIVPAQSK
jgi:hypothetical protein